MNIETFFSELEKTSTNNFKLKYAFAGYLISINYMLSDDDNKYREDAKNAIIVYISSCLNDLNKELEIVELMKKYINKCNELHCPDYFENSNEYMLFVSILKKLSNSLVIREMNLNQIVNEYNRLTMYNAFTSSTSINLVNNYLNEHDYDIFIDTLKTL